MSFADTPTLSNARVTLEALSHAHAQDLAVASGQDNLWESAWYTTIPAPDAVAAEIDRRLGLQRRWADGAVGNHRPCDGRGGWHDHVYEHRRAE